MESGSSANIKLSKTQFHKIVQPGGFLGRLLGPFLKTRFPLMKNVLKPLAKSALISLILTAAASATDAGIYKKMFGSGRPLELIVSNEEINDIMKLIQSFKESGLLIKGISETTKNEAKEQKGRLLSVLLGTLGAGLLGNLLTDKGTTGASEGTIRAGKGTIRGGEDTTRAGFSMLPHL